MNVRRAVFDTNIVVSALVDLMVLRGMPGLLILSAAELRQLLAGEVPQQDG